jgi:hypothetical protein
VLQLSSVAVKAPLNRAGVRVKTRAPMRCHWTASQRLPAGLLALTNIKSFGAATGAGPNGGNAR